MGNPQFGDSLLVIYRTQYFNSHHTRLPYPHHTSWRKIAEHTELMHMRHAISNMVHCESLKMTFEADFCKSISDNLSPSKSNSASYMIYPALVKHLSSAFILHIKPQQNLIYRSTSFSASHVAY